jgi:NTP pyrophosphatase (non-canonical NTP hydrolase)
MHPAPKQPTPAEVLNALAAEAHECALNKGWYQGRKREAPELLCLIHSEVSETLEALRNGNPPSDHLPNTCQAEEEMADVIIRCLDMCAYMGWNIGEVVRLKMAHNWQRPHRHGGKLY